MVFDVKKGIAIITVEKNREEMCFMFKQKIRFK
jgi:hypothetical protein